MKKLTTVLITLILCFWHENASAQVGPAGVDCGQFDGLVNRIIQCISHLTGTAVINQSIQNVHDYFVAASTARQV